MSETKAASTVTKPQARILEVLSKAKGPMTDAMLADKASVARSWITGFVFKACKANRTPSLVEQKLAKPEFLPVDGSERKERAYSITAAGKKLVGRASAAGKSKKAEATAQA